VRLKQILIGATCAITLFSFSSTIFAGAVTSKENIAVSTTGGGIKIKSDNGNSFQFGGFIQYDFDSYDGLYNAGTADPADIGDSANESEWRRTRISAKGTRGENWAYDFTIDIDDDANEASVDAASIRYKGFKNTQLILGRLKAPFGLEELTSDKWVSTIERSAIYGVGNFLSGKPDFQFAAHGNWDNLSGQIHFIDEGEEDDDSQNDSSDAFSIAARIANRFLIGDQETKPHFAHLGAAYAARDFGNEGSSMNFRSRLGAHTISNRPTAGTTRVGDADQFGLEAAYVNGPFSLQGEYLTADFDGEGTGADVDVDGFYALVTYMLTGEARGYKTSSSKFDKPKPKNSFGAWELVAKYEDGEVDIDSQPNESEYDILTLGVNWYPNTNLRFSLNYLMADADNFEVGGTSLEALGEDDGDAVSFRAQYAF